MKAPTGSARTPGKAKQAAKKVKPKSADPRPRRMARRDAGPHAGADPGSRPRHDRRVEVDGHSGLVAAGDCLHRGGVHEGREADVRPGASIADPSRLFNASLDGNTRRAIDIPEGDKVDAGAFKALVKAAVARNAVAAKKR